MKYSRFFLTSIFISLSLLQCKGDLSNALKDTHDELTEKQIKITVSQSPVTTESGGSDTIPIVMTGPPVSPVTIPIASSNTAEGTVDKNSIIFDKTNWNVAQTITVTGVDDDIDDDDQVYSIQVGPTRSNDPNFNNITFQNINFTNQDDDPMPDISIANVTVTEEDADSLATFTVTLSRASGKTVSVDYTTADVSAIAGSDYTASSGTMTFNPGETARDITVTITGDVLEEQNESFQVQLSNPVNTSIITATGTCDIIDNDRDGPKIVSAEYLDTDSNGRIDHVRITFDEALLDSSFDGFDTSGTPSDQEHNVTSVWSVAGYVNVRMDTRDVINSVTGDTGSDDNVIWLAFDEAGSGYDTGTKPELTASDSSLTDSTTGMCFIQTDNTGCSDQSQAIINTGDVVGTDKAPPMIVNASGLTSSDVLSITFSEPVDSTLGGGCTGALAQADFQYNDVSGGDIDGIDTETSWTDTDGCDDNIVKIRITDGGTPANLSANDINLDTIQPAAASIYDAADNIALTTAKTITGAIAPYVLNVVSTSSTTIRITFSEAVDTAQATTLTSYELHYNDSCTNVITAPTAVSQISTSVYELDTVAQTFGQTYCLLVTGTINDQNEGLPVTDPKFSAFLGDEQLKIVSASCIDTANIKVVFNKDVLSGGGVNGADNTANYTITGVSNLGGISVASLSNNEVTLTHAAAQDGSIYTVIGNTAIRDSADTENLQASPNDRAPFTGCGTEVTNFSDGPISSDPFGDGSDFGYVNTYNGKIFVGPNTNGNGVNRFEPAGTNPVNVDFSFAQDITGVRVSSNTAGLPFLSIGHSGCTFNSNDKDLGCGPDNEDGRGLFASGNISGTEYLFITGARSAGDNDYLYWTTDTDTTLNFNYIDLSDTFDTGDDVAINNNGGTESIAIMNDKIYWMLPGSGGYSPYLIKINDLTAESINNTNSVYLAFRYMIGIGQYSFSKPNWADNLGATLFVFNNILYVGNNGSVRDITNSDYDCPVGSTSSSATACNNDGGIVRSNTNDPAACTTADTCDFTDITPTNLKFINYFSILLPQLADLTPAMRPIPAFAGFNGNLYMIRNACITNMIDSGGIDATCPGGSQVPQLWKCDPTSGASNDTFCDNDEWSIVADNTTAGYTNMGDANNTKITLLLTNGTYLYVGFDNSTTGIEIYRANVSSPANESDFSQIGGDGLGDPTNNQEIYSAISDQDGVDFYIYVSTGQSGVPVSVYRQKNN